MQWLMLQQEEPKDYVIATGRMESIRNFIELCANELGWYCKDSKNLLSGKGKVLMK